MDENMQRYLHTVALLACLCLMYACAAGKKDIPDSPTADPALLAKYNTYVNLAGSYPDDDCDWLLFASLIDVAGGVKANVPGARDAKGRWHRTVAQDCYPDRSKSTISKDMFMGLLWWLWFNERVDLAEETFEYGLDHTFVMGDGPKSRVYMSENEQYTLALIVHVLGGKDFTVWKFEPLWVGDAVDSYGAHLEVIHAALRALLGYGRDGAKEALAEHVAAQPNNPLFHAALGLYTGDQTRATELLLDERMCPSTRLPTSADRCDAWFTQRNEDEDWQPCPDEGLTHSGGDCLFALALVTGSIRNVTEGAD
jgi:hypothetical protein